ncbi:MAG: diguanylate cyclase [Pseudomonadota bacterium]
MQSSRPPILAFALAAVLAALASAPAARGQSEGSSEDQPQANIWSDASDVHFEALTLADGLSDSTVYSISQDGKGQLWFGLAAGGANRFDGYRVDAFMHDPADADSISHSAAGEALATRDGTVLVGTWGGGLNRLLDPAGRFARINPQAPPRRIQVLFEDSRSRVWIGSADDGLYRLDSATSDALTPVRRPDGQMFTRVWSIAEDASGQLWIATDQGLSNLAGLELTPAAGWTGNPRALLYAGETLWAADSQAVYRMVGGELLEVARNLPLVNTLASSPGGEVLAGTLAGILAFDLAGRPVPPFGRRELSVFPDRNIRRFFFDANQMGWIATREAGVILAVPSARGFDGFALDSSLDTADTLIELAPDDLLLGSRRGLWRLKRSGSASELRQIPSSEGLSVNRLALGPESVLVGTTNGVLAFDPATEQLKPNPRFAALEGEMVTAFATYPDGTVDVGTFTRGVFRFPANGTARQFVQGGSSPVPGTAVSDLEVDGTGRTWVGLWDQGIATIDGDGNVTAYERDRLNIEGLIHDLLPVGQDLWIATSFGLSRFDPESGRTAGLELIGEYPTTAVQRLAADRERIWAATTRGVVAVNRDNLAVTRFTAADGLVVEEFFARAGYVGRNGRIYFGGLGGFVSFLPDRVLLNPRPPSLAITRAWVDGAPTSADQPIVLPPGAATVRLSYLASDYRSPAANRFRWRLTGQDDQWSPARAERETLLTGLTPGEYQFELQAANANGIWNDRSVTLPIVAEPAWWQTLRGRVAAVLGLLAVVYALSYWNTQRIRARNRTLTAAVERQTRELREANQSLARAAATDHLTGLLNRRGFLEQVEALRPDPHRHFALLDADDFKQVNDRYGHDVGDAVLVHLADLLRKASPINALVARWGGEEFIVHFREQDLNGAHRVMEGVRERVRDQQPRLTSNIEPLSITIGLAQMAPGETCMDTINRADNFLLAGKSSGKNRVVHLEAPEPAE